MKLTILVLPLIAMLTTATNGGDNTRFADFDDVPLHKGHVSLGTGWYVREDDDAVVETPLPMIVRRTYIGAYHHVREFGVGTTHSGEWMLHGDGDPRVSWADVIFADATRVHFKRISPGTSQETAVLRSSGIAGKYEGALMRWNGTRWVMTLRNGSGAVFLDCQDDHERCVVVEQSDADGNRITYVRDRERNLLRMESAGQYIKFEYDEHGRIRRLSDSADHAVTYTYGDGGRLTKASYAAGATRTYAYDDRDNMVEIRDPRRIVINAFDDTGRMIKQIVKDSDDDDDPWIFTVSYEIENDRVLKATTSADDEGRQIYQFNRDYYLTSRTFDADGPAPIILAFKRSEETNAPEAVTVTCGDPNRPTTRTIPLRAELDDGVEEWLAHRVCGRQ